MKKYKLIITFVSDALPGSGEGFGAVIDSDIVFDHNGVPYLPAKRVKGCLRESANDVCAMLVNSKIDPLGDLKLEEATAESMGEQYNAVNRVFGIPGNETPASLYFSNLTIPHYSRNSAALDYFQARFPGLVSTEQVVQTYAYTRQSTAIAENGIADDHSLRTCRVLASGISFEGTLHLPEGDNPAEQLLALACLNFRRMGYKRNRGFGEILCRMEDEGGEIDFPLWAGLEGGNHA